jgi:hypothetical protein
MEVEEKAQGDLKYVREVVERSEGQQVPSGIYYLWAVICLIGFPLNDFASGHFVGMFWMIAAPAGFILSGVIGWRFSSKTGQVDLQRTKIIVLHWLGTLVAIGLVSILVINGALEVWAMGQAILLILALSYFTAGLYQDRPLLWVGLILGLSFVLAAFVQGYIWTILGIVVAGSLVASALIGGRRARG